MTALALLVRLLLVPFFHERGYTSDETEYISLARSLAAGNEFVDSNGAYSIRAPLFPYWLGFLFSTVGENIPLSHVMNCLLGASLVPLVFFGGVQLFANPGAALVASVLVAFHPGLVIYSTLLQTETLYTVLLMLAFLALLDLYDTPTYRAALAFGFAAGLASLTRAVFVGLFPVLILAFLWSKRQAIVPILPKTVVAILAWCLALAPWTLRNYAVHERLVPVSSGGGASLLTGNNPYATGTWRVKSGFDEWLAGQAKTRGVESIHALPEYEASTLEGRIAAAFIVENPWMATKLAVKKAYIFWVFPITNSDSYLPPQFVAVMFDAIFYLLAGVGLVATWKMQPHLTPVYLAIAFTFCMHVVLHSEARFRLPVVPLLALFGGVAGQVVVHRQKLQDFLRTRSNKLAVISVLAFVFVVYACTGILFLNHVI